MNFRSELSPKTGASARACRRLRRGVVVAFAWVLGGAALVGAEPGLLQQAKQALQEGIAPVAIAQLRDFLARPGLTAEEDRDGRLLLGEALLEAGYFDQGLEAIQPLAQQGHRAALLLKADLLGGAERWPEALAIYREEAARPDGAAAARLGEVEALKATGDLAGAVAVLEAVVRETAPSAAVQLRLAGLYAEQRRIREARATLARVGTLSPADQQWKRSIEGRLFLLEDQPEPALLSFARILEDSGKISEALLVAATFGMTEARTITEGLDAADAVLEGFIARYPESRYLEEVFRRLDAIYAREEAPSESELKSWTQKAPARRAARASVSLAQLQIRAGKFEKARGTLDHFLKTHPNHPLQARVQEMRAGLFVRERNFAGAIAALEAAQRQATSEDARAEIELQAGLVYYRSGEYLLAANLFDSVAEKVAKRERLDQGLPTRRESRAMEIVRLALYNGALAALNQQNSARFEERSRELSRLFPESSLRSDLILEQGLIQARVGKPEATRSLEQFIRNFPGHPRLPEARLALAEIAFTGGRWDLAEDYRRVVNPGGDTELSDQSAYLALFLADAQRPAKDEDVIAMALDFIRDRPDSRRVPEVRMKLGEVYFRRENFADAETQFDTVAKNPVESGYGETALFLAGQSAMRTINTGSVSRALKYFEQVVDRNGPLKLYARQQQALIQSRSGKEDEAVKIYENILAAQPPPDSELRYAALCGKGDNLLVLAQKDEKAGGDAVASFEKLAAQPEVPASWRNQALFKKAQALELAADREGALRAYYDVLQFTLQGEEREYFWFTKAGFEAARILESQAQWKAAVGVYEKIAAAQGPRAQEAIARVKQLRLEHFLWD